MKNLSLFVFMFTFLFYSCSNDTTVNENTKTVSQETIEGIIEDLKESNTIDKDKVSELINSIDIYSKANATNKNTPKYLELKAKYLGAMGQNAEALKVYNDIYTNYKQYENRPDALFMMAFLYENNMLNKEKAKAYYQKYLDEFPNEDFAKDAQFSLDNIDKTPEELMEMFNKQNVETTE